MNDFVELTDQFNELLEEYSLGEESTGIVDLDAWAICDLEGLLDIVTATVDLRRAHRPLYDENSWRD